MKNYLRIVKEIVRHFRKYAHSRTPPVSLVLHKDWKLGESANLVLYKGKTKCVFKFFIIFSRFTCLVILSEIQLALNTVPERILSRHRRRT